MQRWYYWLQEMKNRYEEKRKEEEHHKLVGRMIASAEGGAGLLHKITKPTAWRSASVGAGGERCKTLAEM